MSAALGALSCFLVLGLLSRAMAVAQPLPLPPPAAPMPAAQSPAPAARAGALPLPPPPPPDPEDEPAETTPEARAGKVTNLPMPRFAALKTDEVNLRVGPGRRYPVEWVYKRRGLPVRIEREFDVWRLIRDPDGIQGWVHQATLTGRRMFFVTGEIRALRAEPSEDARVVARLEPGVLGQLRRCDAQALWCQVRVEDRSGWLKRTDFWGTLPGEGLN